MQHFLTAGLLQVELFCRSAEGRASRMGRFLRDPPVVSQKPVPRPTDRGRGGLAEQVPLPTARGVSHPLLTFRCQFLSANCTICAAAPFSTQRHLSFEPTPEDHSSALSADLVLGVTGCNIFPQLSKTVLVVARCCTDTITRGF